MNPITEEHLSTAELAGRTVATTQDFQRTEPKEYDRPGALLPADFVQDLKTKWDRVQTGFVDEPRTAVQEADELVAQAMKRLAEVFADERKRLEQQWDRGDNVNTEDLRVALRTYRSFFQRLLSV